ncbi:MAG TPA: hypothetical protein VMX55_08020 [candidate division Zixibacteria bacterium]|nr:hypothetical protein [candidate division Zixibacteria bacterium]
MKGFVHEISILNIHYPPWFNFIEFFIIIFPVLVLILSLIILPIVDFLRSSSGQRLKKSKTIILVGTMIMSFLFLINIIISSVQIASSINQNLRLYFLDFDLLYNPLISGSISFLILPVTLVGMIFLFKEIASNKQLKNNKLILAFAICSILFYSASRFIILEFATQFYFQISYSVKIYGSLLAAVFVFCSILCLFIIRILLNQTLKNNEEKFNKKTRFITPYILFGIGLVYLIGNIICFNFGNVFPNETTEMVLFYLFTISHLILNAVFIGFFVELNIIANRLKINEQFETSIEPILESNDSSKIGIK